MLSELHSGHISPHVSETPQLTLELSPTNEFQSRFPCSRVLPRQQVVSSVSSCVVFNVGYLQLLQAFLSDGSLRVGNFLCFQPPISGGGSLGSAGLGVRGLRGEPDHQTFKPPPPEPNISPSFLMLKCCQQIVQRDVCLCEHVALNRCMSLNVRRHEPFVSFKILQTLETRNASLMEQGKLCMRRGRIQGRGWRGMGEVSSRPRVWHVSALVDRGWTGGSVSGGSMTTHD